MPTQTPTTTAARPMKLPLARFEIAPEIFLSVAVGAAVALIVAFDAKVVVAFVGAATKVVVVVVVVPR